MPISFVFSTQSHAAGSAYQVDTGEVNDPGFCKVDTWASFPISVIQERQTRFLLLCQSELFIAVGSVRIDALNSHVRVLDGEWDSESSPSSARSAFRRSRKA